MNPCKFLLNVTCFRIKIDYIDFWEVTDMEKNEIKEKLLGIIEEELPEVVAEDVDMDASFVDEYGVDSVSLIKMIVDAEQTFQVKFDDHELALNRYDNFEDVVEVIEGKLK